MPCFKGPRATGAGGWYKALAPLRESQPQSQVLCQDTVTCTQRPFIPATVRSLCTQHSACLIISLSPPSCARERYYYGLCLSGQEADGQKGEVSQPVWLLHTQRAGTHFCTCPHLTCSPFTATEAGSGGDSGTHHRPSLHTESSQPNWVIEHTCSLVTPMCPVLVLCFMEFFVLRLFIYLFTYF